MLVIKDKFQGKELSMCNNKKNIINPSATGSDSDNNKNSSRMVNKDKDTNPSSMIFAILSGILTWNRESRTKVIDL